MSVAVMPSDSSALLDDVDGSLQNYYKKILKTNEWHYVSGES